jgi:hypothetical protein
MRSFVIAGALAALVAATGRAEVSDHFPWRLEVEQQADLLVITRDLQPVATYIFADREILRPYFTQVHTPHGTLITRHHPPREGVDALDHSTMHPGIWLAFGDLGGSDFWRNKGRVEHVEFVEKPRATMDGKYGVISFAAKQRYVSGDKVVCNELARHTIRATRSGFLFTFGLGVRVTTPVVVRDGTGKITNSEGRTNEKEVWGRQADWCDYSGKMTATIEREDRTIALRAGVLVVPHPENFRRSWMHARDYGMLVANPFGQKAFTRGEASRVEVRPGEKLRLRFGVWSYAVNITEEVDLAALAAEYVKRADAP